MNAMQLHEIIGDLIVAILLAAAIVAALLYMVLLLSGGFGMRSDDSDVIGSHLVSADGKSWDFSKENHSSKARAQRDIRPANDVPDKWDGFDIVPHHGETRPTTSDMDMEIIVDAEIIHE